MGAGSRSRRRLTSGGVARFRFPPAALAALVLALALDAAATELRLYGPIELTEANGVRHADCTGATWQPFDLGPVVMWNPAVGKSTVHQWLEAKPHPVEPNKGCGDELAEGTAIRIYSQGQVRIYITPGSIADFRRQLLNR